MFPSPIVLIHVCGATIAVIAGALAMIFRKGSSLHRVAGNFFVGAMAIMLVPAVISAALLRPNAGNAVGGSLALYLVATGWVAGRRRECTTGLFDRIALLWVLLVMTADMTFGTLAMKSPTHTLSGYPPEMYFVFGIIALIHAAFDVRMLVRGGVAGAQRLGRHLWRLCFAFMITLLSFYPGNARLFPRELRKTNLLYIPIVLLIGSTFLWLSRTSRRDLRSVRA